MDKNQFLEMVKEIGTIEDDVERRTKLTELTDGVSSIFDTNSALEEKNKQYVEDNEKLRSANMQLFLRVGADKSDDEIRKEETGTEKEPEPRKFKDLFDDNGNLK